MASYASAAYLESLSEYGAPVNLPASGAGFLEERIGPRLLYDARGAYPLLSAKDWRALPGDLAENPRRWVSVVSVPDPLTAPCWDELADIFQHVCRPYKEHYVVDLDGHYAGPFSEGHRRSVRRAASLLELEWVRNPADAICDWTKLYGYLVYRHDIKGIARFSRKSFEAQLAHPNLYALRAHRGEEVVGMSLWILDGDRAYYHLGACNQLGYESGASFGLFADAIGEFQKMGVRQVLLGGGSAQIGEEMDGLARFKAGWASRTVTAFLCGRIFDMPRYQELSRGIITDFFPAYRMGRLISAATPRIFTPIPSRQAA